MDKKLKEPRVNPRVLLSKRTEKEAGTETRGTFSES